MADQFCSGLHAAERAGNRVLGGAARGQPPRARQASLSRSRRGSLRARVRRPFGQGAGLVENQVSIWLRPSSTWPRVSSRPSLCRLPVAVVSAVGVASDGAGAGGNQQGEDDPEGPLRVYLPPEQADQRR